MTTKREIEAEINALQQLLAKSDYKALKHADGALTDDEYAAAKAERQGFRDRINVLQEELANLPVEAREGGE